MQAVLQEQQSASFSAFNFGDETRATPSTAMSAPTEEPSGSLEVHAETQLSGSQKLQHLKAMQAQKLQELQKQAKPGVKMSSSTPVTLVPPKAATGRTMRRTGGVSGPSTPFIEAPGKKITLENACICAGVFGAQMTGSEFARGDEISVRLQLSGVVFDEMRRANLSLRLSILCSSSQREVNQIKGFN